VAPGSTSLRDLARAVRQALSHPVGDGAPAASLDLSGLVIDPPRIRECVVVEGLRIDAVAIDEEPVVGFQAFLDGAQQSHVVDYADTIPIVAGRTAAVVRTRVNRRMVTWGSGAVEESRLYVPLRLLSPSAKQNIRATGLEVCDTIEPHDEVSGHPLELLRRAVDGVKRDRERLEQGLAEAWVGSTTDGILFVDGGLPNGDQASMSSSSVGVVKSHHTIYAAGEGLAAVLGLAEGQRSSVFLIERTWGPRVLSWYLRLRKPPSHDPFMGLVRVEVANESALEDPRRLTQRAHDVSRWILAERAPLAMPDARWDRMVYGIRDCEEYLRATAG
jgi:hypothetical protein